MANTINYWVKTAVSSIADTKRFLISGTTGAADVVTWLVLKGLIKAYLIAETMTFSGVITFAQNIVMGSHKITGLANGTDTNDAVNKSQLDLKMNVNGGEGFSARVIFNQAGINIPEFAGTFPTTAGDSQGHEGDIIRSGKRLALKTTVDGWCYIDFIRM